MAEQFTKEISWHSAQQGPARGEQKLIQVTIPDGSDTTNYFVAGNYTLAGVEVDANFDGASLVVMNANKVSHITANEVPSAGDYHEVANMAGSAMTITIASDRPCQIPRGTFPALGFVKLKANAAQSGADCVVTVCLRAVL